MTDHSRCVGVALTRFNEGIVFVICHQSFLVTQARADLLDGIWEWREAGYPDGIFFIPSRKHAYFWVPAFTPGHEP